jgi:hypothetical protein
MSFNIDKALNEISARYTPEQRAEDEARNRTIIASMGPKIARAQQQMAAMLEQMQFLNTQPESQLKQDRLAVVHKRLAELIAETGDWTFARQYADDPEQQAFFGRIEAAIARDDDDVCDCADARMHDRTRNQEFTEPVRVPIMQIPSEERGRLLTVEQCTSCGFLNAK